MRPGLPVFLFLLMMSVGDFVKAQGLRVGAYVGVSQPLDNRILYTGETGTYAFDIRHNRRLLTSLQFDYRLAGGPWWLLAGLSTETTDYYFSDQVTARSESVTMPTRSLRAINDHRRRDMAAIRLGTGRRFSLGRRLSIGLSAAAQVEIAGTSIFGIRYRCATGIVSSPRIRNVGNVDDYPISYARNAIYLGTLIRASVEYRLFRRVIFSAGTIYQRNISSAFSYINSSDPSFTKAVAGLRYRAVGLQAGLAWTFGKL